tara:strand:+ start:20419 stop:21126 length:708 start_codon:yes stop_codon:yes gene_type:complete
MSGTFPDVTKFKSIAVRSDSNQLTQIDANNKLYSLSTNQSADNEFGFTKGIEGLGHAWEFDFTTVPLTRAEMAPMYSFLCAQNGTAETFTIKPPGTAHQYIFDTSSNRTFDLAQTALVKGSVGVFTRIDSTENSQDVSEDGGVTFINTGDYLRFVNHDKVYIWRGSRFSVGCANFGGSLFSQNGYIWPPLQADVPTGTDLNWDPNFTVALISEPQVTETDEEGFFTLSFSVREEA